MKESIFSQYKFRPLHNVDGSPCYFRVVCLALFACSLIMHVMLKDVDSENQSNSGEIYIASAKEVDFAALRLDNEVSEDASSWDLFDFNKKSKDKELFSNRKQALSELQDGANFFSSCGNINASYQNCKFAFSNKVSPHFDSSIQVSNSSFQITLVAKGQQQDDECVKFVATSKGEYQAYNAIGQESKQCFLHTNLKDFVLTQN